MLQLSACDACRLLKGFCLSCHLHTPLSICLPQKGAGSTHAWSRSIWSPGQKEMDLGQHVFEDTASPAILFKPLCLSTALPVPDELSGPQQVSDRNEWIITQILGFVRVGSGEGCLPGDSPYSPGEQDSDGMTLSCSLTSLSFPPFPPAVSPQNKHVPKLLS